MKSSDRSKKETETEPVEGKNREQSSALLSRIHRLEREVENLKNDKQELQDRILQLRNEYAQKYDSLTTSITFRAGDVLVEAATSLKGAIALPFRLWRIYRDYRSKKSRQPRPEVTPLEKREPTLYESTIATVNGPVILPTTQRGRIQEARILFMPTNGGGLGHVTRLLAIARRLKTDTRITEVIFLITSQALDVLQREGFIAYHHPPPDQLMDRISAKGWQSSLRSLSDVIVNNHGINVFVFDGMSADLLATAIAQHKSMCKVWIRRMLLKEGKEEIFNRQAGLFDLQLVPGELGQESITQDSAGRIIVPPMVFLDRNELLPRQDVVEQLGLNPAKKTVFVQLGAGNINDINTQSEIIIETAQQFTDVQVVLAESPISHGRFKCFQGVRAIRDYPLSRYYQGFDIAISAAGYNTVTELGYFGVPSIFIPNVETGSDNQLGRATIAQQTGTGLLLSPLTASGLRACLEKLLDNTNNAEYRKRCLSLCPVNGSDIAAQVLADFLFQ